MELGDITGSVDTAQVLLYLFWIFFFGLIFYIRQEDRREGYPLESDVPGHYEKDGWLFMPTPKTFKLPHGHGDVTVPNADRDNEKRKVPGEKTGRFSGAPYTPTGENPMLDSIGPGSWAERSNVPDLTFDGHVKIVPMSKAPEFSIAKQDMDPRGMRVVGHDSVIGGTVTDVWVDKAEQVIRYLEITTDSGIDETPHAVLVPMNFCTIKTPRDRTKIFYVHAIKGAQFALVPKTRKRAEVTFLEEDKIMAYYGSGLLYSDESRIGPKL